MKKPELLNYLRDIYKTGNKALLKREYYKNIFFLDKEDRDRIFRALNKMPDGVSMEEVKKIIGGNIIE